MSAAPTLRRLSDLAQAGLIAPEQIAGLEQVAEQYAIAITPALVELIHPGDPLDPIGAQFLPTVAELKVESFESADPVGDAAYSPVEGIVHRYPDRALLKITHTCAVYCRFCFRREMVGPKGLRPLSETELETAFGYLESHPEIWELIVTGGDPLVLSPRRLRDLMTRLQAIEHIRVIRFHTRVPTVDPDAISDEMVQALKAPGKAVYLAVHINHARELTDKARAACGKLVDAGIPLLGQTVLLRGINDDPASLGDLMRAQVETRIKPYYLHHGDLAPGAGHFRTTIAEGRALMKALRGTYSGLCQPTYVLDIPEGHGKVPIGPNYVSEGAAGCVVEDPWGELHDYNLEPVGITDGQTS